MRDRHYRLEEDVSSVERNWAGNFTFTASDIHRPETIDELCQVVAQAPRIHVAGACHSFNSIADSAEMIILDQLQAEIEIDQAASTVTVGAGVTYGDLAIALERAGLALHNTASLPHITVGGAVATATHGSGDHLGNLATAVAGIELVTTDGDVVQVDRGHDDFEGMVVGLGALGAVSRLTLDVQPRYMMQQVVFEHLSWDVLFDQFDQIMSCATSVSLFHDFGDDIGEMWQKTRVDPNNPVSPRDQSFGASAATRNLHPVPTLDASHCTEQMGVVGAWLDRLPHFKVDSIPASGHEIQSEYMVDRKDAVAALQALRGIAPEFRGHLLASEIRSVAADNLWLSSSYQRDTICIHFSFAFDPPAVEGFLPTIESVLEPFEPRPHWGKVFYTNAEELEGRYERLSDFRRLAQRLDPRGAFRNEFVTRHVFG